MTEGPRPFRVHPEVEDAVRQGRPVVALESTIFSRLGLPDPAGRECLARVTAAIVEEGALPALTGVVDGVACVGITGTSLEPLLAATVKVAERDLPAAAVGGLPAGATTVSAATALAALAGIAVFATGGIGGVHRDAAESGDVSADIGALARHPVAVVSSGAKAFLDLARTLEALESASVPVVGFGTDELPAFWSRSSGLPLAARVDGPAEAASFVRAARALGWRGGILFANPVPAAAEIPAGEIADAIAEGLAEASRRGTRGAAVTPVVLAAIGRVTAGRSVPANLALAESNARVAARIACALSG